MANFDNVEFVDGGDSGRSPIAKAVARRWFGQQRIMGVGVMSSGTLVDFLGGATDAQILEVVAPYLGTMADVGAITGEQITDLEAGRNVGKIIKPLVERMGADEKSRTGEILRRRGLLPYVETGRSYHPRQTIVRPNAGLILAIDVANFERVCQAYGEPTSATIGAIGDIRDTFFMDLKGHEEIADQIEAATVEAMKRYL